MSAKTKTTKTAKIKTNRPRKYKKRKATAQSQYEAGQALLATTVEKVFTRASKMPEPFQAGVNKALEKLTQQVALHGYIARAVRAQIQAAQARG